MEAHMRPRNIITLFSLVVALYSAGCAKGNSADETDFFADDITTADTAAVQDEQPQPENVAPVENADMNNTVADAAPPVEDPIVPLAEPEQTPPPATADLAANSYGTGAIENYNVQAGDTLMKIAFNIYGDIDAWKQIYDMNRDQLSSAKALKKGQVLKYEKPAEAVTISQNGDPYLIKSGDTLGTISNDIYATPKKWRALYENNRQLIKDPNKIYVGFYLYYHISESEKAQAEKIKLSRAGSVQPEAPRTPAAASALEAGPAAAAATAQQATGTVTQ